MTKVTAEEMAEEMAEILTHAVFYAGWPKAWAAFGMAKDISSAENTVSVWLEEIGMMKESVGTENTETAITITIGDTVLDGVIYDTALAQEIKEYFPLTISMSGFGGREYYGGVDFYPAEENLAE